MMHVQILFLLKHNDKSVWKIIAKVTIPVLVFPDPSLGTWERGCGSKHWRSSIVQSLQRRPRLCIEIQKLLLLSKLTKNIYWYGMRFTFTRSCWCILCGPWVPLCAGRLRLGSRRRRRWTFSTRRSASLSGHEIQLWTPWRMRYLASLKKESIKEK